MRGEHKRRVREQKEKEVKHQEQRTLIKKKLKKIYQKRRAIRKHRKNENKLQNNNEVRG